MYLTIKFVRARRNLVINTVRARRNLTKKLSGLAGVFDNKLSGPGRVGKSRRKREKVGKGGKGCGHPMAPNKSDPSLLS